MKLTYFFLQRMSLYARIYHHMSCDRVSQLFIVLIIFRPQVRAEVQKAQREEFGGIVDECEEEMERMREGFEMKILAMQTQIDSLQQQLTQLIVNLTLQGISGL